MCFESICKFEPINENNAGFLCGVCWCSETVLIQSMLHFRKSMHPYPWTSITGYSKQGGEREQEAVFSTNKAAHAINIEVLKHTQTCQFDCMCFCKVRSETASLMDKLSDTHANTSFKAFSKPSLICLGYIPHLFFSCCSLAICASRKCSQNFIEGLYRPA